MPARRKLTTLNQGRAIEWLQNGEWSGQMTGSVSFSHCQTKSPLSGHKRCPREAQVRGPKKTAPREDRFIQRKALQHRHDHPRAAEDSWGQTPAPSSMRGRSACHEVNKKIIVTSRSLLWNSFEYLTSLLTKFKKIQTFSCNLINF